MKVKESWGMAMSEWLEIENKRETELQELCTVTETYDVKPVTLSENVGIQRLRESSEFLDVKSHLNNDLPSSIRCRLCANPNNDMVDIFSSTETEQNILDKIKHSLPIAVKESDSLPKQACKSCLAKLELCYQFHQTVVEAERQLLAFDRLESVKLEVIVQNDSFHVQCEPTEYNNIDEPCKTNSDVKMDNKRAETVPEETQTSDETVMSNVSPSRSRPNTVVLSIIKTRNKNNMEAENLRKSSNDTEHRNQNLTTEVFDSGKTMASGIDQQSTRDSELANSDIHARVRIRKRRYQCNSCEKTFKAKKDLDRHNRLHTGKGLYPCEYCGKNFIQRKLRDRHHRIHTNERPLKCPICRKSFNYVSTLKRHETVHSEERNYPCSLCDKSYKSFQSRQTHMLVHNSSRL